MGVRWGEAGIPQRRTAPRPPQRTIRTRTPAGPRLGSSGLPVAAPPPGTHEGSSLAPRHLPGAVRTFLPWLRCRRNLLWPLGGSNTFPAQAVSRRVEREEERAALRKEGIWERTPRLSDQLPQTRVLPRSWLHLLCTPSALYSQPWASGMLGQGLKTQAQVHGGPDSVSCSPSTSGKGHSLWLFPHGNCQLPCWGESEGYFREG